MESIARKGIPKPSVLAAFLVPFTAEGKRHSRRGAKYPLRGTGCHVGLRPPRNDGMAGRGRIATGARRPRNDRAVPQGHLLRCVGDAGPYGGTDCHASLRLTPVSLRVGRFAGLTGHRPVIQHREPLKGEAKGEFRACGGG